jgi:hypothetical protein
MNLKNYTSTVPVDRTISRVEQALAEAGASGIVKDYQGGRLVALSFRVELPNGTPVTVRLPANHEAVYATLRSEIKRPRRGTLEKLQEQALRTSWKLMQDWVEVQLSLIRMQQVEFLQVFLPYVWNGRQTYYAALKEQNYRALLPERTEVDDDCAMLARSVSRSSV